MKRIIATIKSHKAHDVKLALSELGVQRVTEIEAHESGLQGKARPRHGLARDQQILSIPESWHAVQLEILVPDADVAQVVETIVNSVKTGQANQGTISIQSVDRVYDAATGKLMTDKQLIRHPRSAPAGPTG